MSTQERGIALHNVPDDTGYRLIELPPELQTLLESDDAPVLTLESSDTVATIKTPNKAYSLNQKNTSNALILLQPHQPDPTSPEQGMAAISTIHETVELQPMADAAATAGASKPLAAKGKWHEKFGKNR